MLPMESTIKITNKTVRQQPAAGKNHNLLHVFASFSVGLIFLGFFSTRWQNQLTISQTGVMHTSKLSYTLLTCPLTCRKQKFFSPLNLNRLQFFIDSGRLNPKEPITMYHLWRSGAVGGRIKDGVKLLGTVSPPYYFFLYCHLVSHEFGRVPVC